MAAPMLAIVGAGTGVSLAVAHRFAQEGYRVAFMARRVDVLSAYVDSFKAEGYEAYGFPADAAHPDSLHLAFTQIRRAWGDPQVLVYNPAVIHATPPTKLRPSTLEADFRVNVVGGLISAQEVLPAMQKAGQGTIIFSGGGLALRPFFEYASLSIGKAGLRSLCYSLAQELTQQNIHVATVTIAGMVKVNTFYDPARIAEKYWELHQQKPREWQTEIIYEEKADEKSSNPRRK
jgi:NAD(P)-dependent dehydrogenase (short-subunit alcohol dehydrogenase family)